MGALTVEAPAGSTIGTLILGEWSTKCALGRSGIVTAKREGDGGTPAGLFPPRCVYYRHDRRSVPETNLESSPLQRDFGWGDDPSDPDHYNRLVLLPHPTRHEQLWLEDAIYDVIIVLGHNDAPRIPGRGSAIFLHLARPGYAPTEGCIAVSEADMAQVLSEIGPQSTIRIAEKQT